MCVCFGPLGQQGTTIVCWDQPIDRCGYTYPSVRASTRIGRPTERCPVVIAGHGPEEGLFTGYAGTSILAASACPLDRVCEGVGVTVGHFHVHVACRAEGSAASPLLIATHSAVRTSQGHG